MPRNTRRGTRNQNTIEQRRAKRSIKRNIARRHHRKCKQVAPFFNKDSRYLPAIWGENKKDHLYKVKLDVNTEDKVGVLSDIGSVFAKSGMNIGSVNTKTIDKKFAGFEIQVEVKNKDELKNIMQSSELARVWDKITQSALNAAQTTGSVPFSNHNPELL